MNWRWQNIALVALLVVCVGGAVWYFGNKAPEPPVPPMPPIPVPIPPTPVPPDLPEVKIGGADKPIPTGELVNLYPIYKKDANLKIEFVWLVLDGYDNKTVMSYGEGVLFGAGKNDKKLLAICSVMGHNKNYLITKEVTIGDPVPPGPNPPVPPGPGPNPPVPPNPDPVFPDGKYKLAKFTYDAVLMNVQNDEKRKLGAIALAKSFNSVAAAISAGVLKTDQDILIETRKSNNLALLYSVGSIDAWEKFSTVLQEQLYGLYKDQKLASVQDYSTAWLEIASGLEKIR